MLYSIFLQLAICAAAVSTAIANDACQRLDPAPSNFSHLGADWAGRCVELYVSLSARPSDDTGRVCGVGVFSADSDLVTAAVHAGLFSGYSFAASTVVRLLPGQAAYRGARRYGVASSDCGPARLSFEFPADQFPSPPAPHELSFYSGMLASFAVRGPAAGSASAAVVGGGGGIYSQASDAGAAAVHAGLVRPGETRCLRVWYLPRRSGFVGGGARNGVAARPEPAGAGEALGFPDTPMFWGSAPVTLAEFSGADGAAMTYRLSCGSPSIFATVRGSGFYQVDSNFAASAIHAGVIRPGETRDLQVEFLGKRDAFQSAYRNGVMSDMAGRGHAYRFLSPIVV